MYVTSAGMEQKKASEKNISQAHLLPEKGEADLGLQAWLFRR
jgi:hypothetical protein